MARFAIGTLLVLVAACAVFSAAAGELEANQRRLQNDHPCTKEYQCCPPTECKSGFHYDGQWKKCVGSCPSGTTQAGNKCYSCDNGLKLVQYNGHYKCTGCPKGYHSTQDDKCVKDCYWGFTEGKDDHWKPICIKPCWGGYHLEGLYCCKPGYEYPKPCGCCKHNDWSKRSGKHGRLLLNGGHDHHNRCCGVCKPWEIEKPCKCKTRPDKKKANYYYPPVCNPIYVDAHCKDVPTCDPTCKQNYYSCGNVCCPYCPDHSKGKFWGGNKVICSC